MFKLRSRILAFLESKKEYPIIAAIATGLYPFLYYYNSNFTLVNSWEQFGFFILCYVFIPICVFYLLYIFFERIDKNKRYLKYLIPIFNLITFSAFVVISTYGFKTKALVLAITVAILIGIVFSRHIKKIIVFQYLLAFFVLLKLVPDIYKVTNYSSKWMAQPDDIENVVFKKKPNIYVIQPDGYANFSKLKDVPYNYDNSNFESFLKDNDFKFYSDFRSNYISTLSSNSSMFAMKHHYYNNSPSGKELYGTRKVIAGDNPVISILKKNGYKSFLLLERSYLLVNRPHLYYDYCNIDLSEVSYLARGFEINKSLVGTMDTLVSNNTETDNFYFLRIMRPSHVSVNKSESRGIKGEREFYLSELEKANQTLKEIINIINNKDENSLIVIMADHGGYIGLNYSMESRIKQTNETTINSIYTSALAIKWPNKVPDFDDKFKTPVNLFRILFSYLSDDTKYLRHLEGDKSYAIINKNAPVGVYEYINENGEVVFSKHKAH
ncbi:hypothetical protein EYD45_04925 [Hyunsoonleella flava]|uniref:Sulfatase N-terminal domain-containing protein n=1 Tax=Hyunsoonleella flava TaxID=2527939 RepID=A0A4Q9FH67_9FLAO|nr:hypothetical protein [Hyunsoonleella flava]TBN05620.1 hypothetical protein EYD45_04925 [Hyunsoonleella flava]